MMAERKLWDEYYMRIFLSGMLAKPSLILDLGTGQNSTMLEIFGHDHTIVPSDLHVGEWNSAIDGMVQVDAENLALSMAGLYAWDAVIMSELLEHVKDPKRVLEQALVVLKPGGKAIVSVPFFYRIHESTPDDPDVTEPYLEDYWRVTPNGLAHLFQTAGYGTYWVGRLVKEGDTDWLPSGVVGWGVKGYFSENDDMLYDTADSDGRIPEDGWHVDLPDNWREVQIDLVAKYEERRRNGQE